MAQFAPAVQRCRGLGPELNPIAKVGTPPRKEDKTLPFCREGATHYRDCEEIKKAGAMTFLLWKVGIGSWMVIGLDASDRVCFRGRVNT